MSACTSLASRDIEIGAGDDESAGPEDRDICPKPASCLRHCVTTTYSIGGSVPVTLDARHLSHVIQSGRFSLRRPLRIESLAILNFRALSDSTKFAVCACSRPRGGGTGTQLFSRESTFGRQSVECSHLAALWLVTRRSLEPLVAGLPPLSSHSTKTCGL